MRRMIVNANGGNKVNQPEPLSPSALIRPLEPGDLPYLHRCYIRNYSETAWRRRLYGIPKQCLDEGLEATWRRMIRDSSGLIAVFSESPDLIMGWVLYEPANQAVHYIHVRERMRRMGVGASLIVDATSKWSAIAYTHDTPDWQEFLTRIKLTAHYDPFRADFSAKEMQG